MLLVFTRAFSVLSTAASLLVGWFSFLLCSGSASHCVLQLLQVHLRNLSKTPHRKQCRMPWCHLFSHMLVYLQFRQYLRHTSTAVSAVSEVQISLNVLQPLCQLHNPLYPLSLPTVYCPQNTT